MLRLSLTSLCRVQFLQVLVQFQHVASIFTHSSFHLSAKDQTMPSIYVEIGLMETMPACLDGDNGRAHETTLRQFSKSDSGFRSYPHRDVVDKIEDAYCTVGYETNRSLYLEALHPAKENEDHKMFLLKWNAHVALNGNSMSEEPFMRMLNRRRWRNEMFDAIALPGTKRARHTHPAPVPAPVLPPLV